MGNKQVAQWGPTVPPKVLHPGFGAPMQEDILTSGVNHYVSEAVEYGFRVVHSLPYKVVLERHHAGGNAGRRAGLGFLLFGFIGAAVGAGTTADARVERIRIWADSHGAIYVKHI